MALKLENRSKFTEGQSVFDELIELVPTMKDQVWVNEEGFIRRFLKTWTHQAL